MKVHENGERYEVVDGDLMFAIPKENVDALPGIYAALVEHRDRHGEILRRAETMYRIAGYHVWDEAPPVARAGWIRAAELEWETQRAALQA